MNHARTARTVLGVLAAYLIALCLWLICLVPHTPPGTLPLQLLVLVGLFGSFLGIGLLLAQGTTLSDRRLLRHGHEGWANIEAVHPLRRTDHCTELTEIDLELVVPGSETFHGSIVFEVEPLQRPKFAVGKTLSIRVDPHNRDRIILCL
ncbi:hypothetical protein [Nocardia huaxiensis]|uniref:DUF4175 domain-containing protein n=1 Tax=Nocardia huaxiensis TaxID=2755382 RepID=A0A7D6ZX70_9NOCA|nr:hypothetical protein [Nocardia huaxiensis]QLY30789.1 hypothetical protein H0264_37830 [Nocardia huaxiensis]UFS94283.1 hypothetical protein LPY97_26425 [Nocardia huaxiensis]